MKTVLFVLFGLVGGVFGGMGMGGGTFLIPLLSLGLDVEQHVSQAINLIAFIPMSIIAIIIHAKNKLLDFKVALFMIVPALFTTVVGAFISRAIGGGVLKKIFGGFLVVIALLRLVPVFSNKVKKRGKSGKTFLSKQ